MSSSENPKGKDISEGSQRKKGTGRKRVDMVKIESESNLQVTFSKRRQGLFKKASELCTLTGAEAAMVVFSPADKAHSFGHPNVETILDRFQGQNPPQDNVGNRMLEAHQNAVILHQNAEVTALEAQLEQEKRKKQELEGIKSAGHAEKWHPVINKLGLEDLEKLSESLTSFKDKLEAKMQNDGPVVDRSGFLWPSSTGHGGDPDFPFGFTFQSNFQGASSTSNVPNLGNANQTLVPGNATFRASFPPTFPASFPSMFPASSPSAFPASSLPKFPESFGDENNLYYLDPATYSAAADDIFSHDPATYGANSNFFLDSFDAMAGNFEFGPPFPDPGAGSSSMVPWQAFGDLGGAGTSGGGSIMAPPETFEDLGGAGTSGGAGFGAAEQEFGQGGGGKFMP